MLFHYLIGYIFNYKHKRKCSKMVITLSNVFRSRIVPRIVMVFTWSFWPVIDSILRNHIIHSYRAHDIRLWLVFIRWQSHDLTRSGYSDDGDHSRDRNTEAGCLHNHQLTGDAHPPPPHYAHILSTLLICTSIRVNSYHICKIY